MEVPHRSPVRSRKPCLLCSTQRSYGEPIPPIREWVDPQGVAKVLALRPVHEQPMNAVFVANHTFGQLRATSARRADDFELDSRPVILDDLPGIESACEHYH